ncbi:MAG: helix-turn-helix transcriptional regulator [Methyloprofundus sp.]|nr:helix-turn-helix transcriptional regulator [Methyloprofundus sp.]
MRIIIKTGYYPQINTAYIMKNTFETIASSSKFIRLQRNIAQETAATESGISLRTLQNIEAGNAVNSSSLFAYLNYLDLLDNMLATLPDPAKLTPLELLKATPNRRARAREAVKNKATPAQSVSIENIVNDKPSFQWGDEK